MATRLERLDIHFVRVLEGDRLFRTEEIVNTSRGDRLSTISDSFIVLLSRTLRDPPGCFFGSISLKLRIRAVVWKRGAHQPGGPPLRTTAAHPFRSSPPGMDADAGCVSPCVASGPETDVITRVQRRQALRC